MWSQDSLLRKVLEQNPIRKRPLERLKLRWEDIVERCRKLRGGSN